jgi:hypothetical protein
MRTHRFALVGLIALTLMACAAPAPTQGGAPAPGYHVQGGCPPAPSPTVNPPGGLS